MSVYYSRPRYVRHALEDLAPLLREGSFTRDGRPKYKIDFFDEAPNGNGGYYVLKITLLFIPEDDTVEIRDSVRAWFHQISSNARSSRMVFQVFDQWFIASRPSIEATLSEGIAGFFRFNRELEALILREQEADLLEEVRRIDRLERLLLL